MIIFIVYQSIQICFLRNDKYALQAGVISLILMLFGLYLWIKNGLISDYREFHVQEIKQAREMFSLALVSLFIGSVFVLSSVIHSLIWHWKLKRRPN